MGNSANRNRERLKVSPNGTELTVKYFAFSLRLACLSDRCHKNMEIAVEGIAKKNRAKVTQGKVWLLHWTKVSTLLICLFFVIWKVCSPSLLSATGNISCSQRIWSLWPPCWKAGMLAFQQEDLSRKNLPFFTAYTSKTNEVKTCSCGRRTGNAKVVGSIPVEAWIFPGCPKIVALATKTSVSSVAVAKLRPDFTQTSPDRKCH